MKEQLSQKGDCPHQIHRSPRTADTTYRARHALSSQKSLRAHNVGGGRPSIGTPHSCDTAANERSLTSPDSKRKTIRGRGPLKLKEAKRSMGGGFASNSAGRDWLIRCRSPMLKWIVFSPPRMPRIPLSVFMASIRGTHWRCFAL